MATNLKGAKFGALTAGTTTTGGDVLALANPEGVDLIVTLLILDVTTPATGTPSVDAGIAADATTSADNLIDGCAVGLAAGSYNSIVNAGEHGEGCVKWGADEYLTVTPSASAAGLVGNYYVQYIRV